MMFLIRSAFWLMIIVLLLPTDEGQQNQVYGTAEAAVKDVATFCDRNPETCVTGKNAFDVLVHKAEFGARILMGFIMERTGLGSDETASSETPATFAPVSGFAPASFDRSASQDTLNSEDREAAWGGPDGAGS